nr:uncharacterized protein LOC102910812 isoform X2 [Peromyscus maniculatus bairdii]
MRTAENTVCGVVGNPPSPVETRARYTFIYWGGSGGADVREKLSFAGIKSLSLRLKAQTWCLVNVRALERTGPPQGASLEEEGEGRALAPPPHHRGLLLAGTPGGQPIGPEGRGLPALWGPALTPPARRSRWTPPQPCCPAPFVLIRLMPTFPWMLDVEAQMPPPGEWKTPPFDPRFPNQNQTRNCYQNFLGPLQTTTGA